MSPSTHRTINVLSTAALLCLSTTTIATPKSAAHWRSRGPDVVYTTPTYTLDIDSATGAPKSLSIAGKPIVTFGKSGWWRATFEDGSAVDAAATPTTITKSGNDIVCKYSSPKITVQLRITPAADHIDLRAYVAPASAVVTRFALPDSIDFSPTSINEVDYPEEIGRALKPAFFERQPDKYAHWTLTSTGPSGASDVGVLPCQMRDYNDPPVPVTVTDLGHTLLGPDAAHADHWQTKCPRAPILPSPERGTSESGRGAGGESVLLDTPNGPLLSMETIGSGRFIRWAGLFNDDDYARVVKTSAALLQKLSNNLLPSPKRGTSVRPEGHFPSAGRTGGGAGGEGNVALLDLNHDSRRERLWATSLNRLGLHTVELRSPAEVRQTLKTGDCWAIVNLDQEIMPCTADDEKSTAALIHAFLAHGGVWLHTGVAPFYYTVEPHHYLSLEGSYPPLFSDFMHIDGKSGQVSVYGVQPQSTMSAYNSSPSRFGRGTEERGGVGSDGSNGFVPAHLTVDADETGGRIGRAWITWIEPGSGWTSPTARIAVGDRVDKAVRAYGVANGFTRPLASKVKASALAKFKQSLLINYSGRTYDDEAAQIKDLPRPSLIHLWDYLHGGFDKQYPDHLPPSPSHGSPSDFKALVDTVHASGDLFMPYTNPTWWCDDPPGPTFVAAGHAPLLVDRQGNNVKEGYSRNWGWALCTFHPAARAAEASILRGFTVDYPADLLFQDQIGARSPEYDFNTAAPNPNSYTEGMREIAERDSRVLPVGTENGFDAVMNPETMFCGVCWGLIPTEYDPDWVSLWRDRYAPGTWTTRPLALWLAHDKVVFTMHDLGQFVTNRETLAWTLALGYDLSIRTSADEVQRTPSDPWITWIAALQKDFGPHIIGAPLTDWREIQPGVFRATYGSTIVLANTTAAPAIVDANATLSPYGFLIVDPVDRAQAGSVVRYHGKDYTKGMDFIAKSGNIETFTPGR